jgi:hypothetical protein
MSEKLKRKSRFSYWIPSIVVTILISIFSTRYLTVEQTGRIIIPAVH